VGLPAPEVAHALAIEAGESGACALTALGQVACTGIAPPDWAMAR